MSNSAATPAEVRHISRCIVTPSSISEESKKPCYLTPWDISMLSIQYIQKGLLFNKPQHLTTITILDRLKHSLSLTLTHFYPLSGRLSTVNQPPTYSVFIDNSQAGGAEFIHAAVDLTISDVISPIDVPPITKSFFTLNGATNHDAHTVPLLSVQVTELLDGIFVGCSYNHAAGDGTSFWHFFNAWAEICRALVTSGEEIQNISHPPITKRWFLRDEHELNLPYTHHDEFIERHRTPIVRERFFHFSAESMARLKAKANEDCGLTNKISSFQALSALMWRSVTRARCFPVDQITSCRLAINSRLRLDPPLSNDYFGNSVLTVGGTSTAGQLLEHNLGWAALLLNQGVAGHTDGTIREWLEAWIKKPFIYQMGRFFDPCSVMMASSPRFDMYTCEFGWGKAVAVRSGYANKFDGKVSSYPGREGGGSVDLEVCLPPDSMCAIESDEEFMSVVSLQLHCSNSLHLCNVKINPKNKSTHCMKS